MLTLVLSQSHEEFLAEARALLEQERPAEALAAIDEALGRAPGDPTALYLRGISLMQLGKFPEAALELAVALEKNPSDAAWREALARAHFRANEPQRAVTVLGPIIEKSPTASVLALHGNALAQLGRSEEAIPYLERAVTLEPDRVQAVFYLARALLDRGRYEDSADRFRSGLDLPAPHNIRFEVGLAEAELRLNRRRQARERLDALLERHPRVARAWYLKGVLEASDARYPEAADAFRKAIDAGYVSAQVLVDYGVALMSAGDRTSAHEAIDRAIARDSRFADAHYYKALLVLENGEAVRQEGLNRPNPFRNEAIGHLDRASALAQQPSMNLALAEIYIKVRRYEQAVEVASRVADAPALAAEAHFVIARAYHELLDTTSAEASYKEAIARGLEGSE